MNINEIDMLPSIHIDSRFQNKLSNLFISIQYNKSNNLWMLLINKGSWMGLENWTLGVGRKMISKRGTKLANLLGSMR